MTIKTAVILAAGLGTRMGPVGAVTPKALIRLGSRPIIEESIEKLISVGITNIVIVTGHLQNSLTYLGDRFAGIVELIHNPHYRSSGSMYSLYLARNVLWDDFCLLECDLTYETNALTTLMQAPFANVILLQSPKGLYDELFVETHCGLLKQLSKDRTRLGPDVAGVFTGLFKISQPLFVSMVTVAEQHFKTSLQLAHGTFLKSMTAFHDIHCVSAPNVLCMEIDNAEHLAIAQSSIYPRIVQKDDESPDSSH